MGTSGSKSSYKYGSTQNDRKMPDFVLVYENIQDENEDEEKVEENRLTQQKRESYLKNLEKLGVKTDQYTIKEPPIEKTYINITVPWDLAKAYGEKLNLMVALKENLFSKMSSADIPEKLTQDYEISNWSESLIGYIGIPKTNIKLPNVMVNGLREFEEKEQYQCMCPFKNSKMDRYLNGDDPEKMFNKTQRHRVAWEILQTMKYTFTYKKKLKKKDRKDEEGEGDDTYTVTKTKMGIEHLVTEGVFSAAYPPHIGDWKAAEDVQPQNMNDRQILDRYWARWGYWYKYQPLDRIRNYFGEKTAFYFAWLGFYTSWLMPVSIVGFLVFLSGLFGMDTNQRSEEICSSGDNFKMCPRCPEDKGCQYWILGDTCFSSKLAYLFDHPGTVFFAAFVALWTVFFLEFWKRMSAQLAYHWNALDVNEVERPSHQFEVQAHDYWEPKIEKKPELEPKAKQTNYITGEKETSFPESLRYIRVVSTYAVLLMMVMIVIIFVVGTIIYRVSLRLVIQQDKTLSKLGSKGALAASMSGACINLILILILGFIYGRIAFYMTKWEMHRTQSDFEDQLAIKTFLFQFTNLYSSVLYVAFFKGKFTGYPGEFGKGDLSWREHCASGGCLFEVAQQMGIIMVGKQILNQAKELFIPKGLQLAKLLWKRYKLRRQTQRQNAENGDVHELQEKESSGKEAEENNKDEHLESETDNNNSDQQLIKPGETIEDEPLILKDDLLPTKNRLLDEYVEMAIQFGFITFFVAAFPLAPVFALLNNWMEIRLDAQKYVRDSRRPVAERAEDIGVWFIILHILGQVAVISNAFLIAFTSDFLPQQLYYYTHGSSEGYTNYSLAFAPVNATKEECRYESFRDHEGNYTLFYWRLMAIRLAFVVIFEHVVFFVMRLIDVFVPDMPEMLSIRIQREEYLAKQALTDLPPPNEDKETES